eukprot:gene21293-27316_t
MANSDKKLIVAVIGGVTKALRKAYDVLNRNEHLPDVQDTDLPGLGAHIIKALEKDLAEINENERFDGLDYEEIIELKDTERKEQLAALQDQAGELLKSLRGPDPVSDDQEEIIDQTDHSQDEDPDVDADQDEDSDIDQDEDSEDIPKITDQLLADLSLKDLIELYNKGTEEIKNLDVNSQEFEILNIRLVSIKAQIDKIQP